MLISRNWLSEYVDISDIDSKELQTKLSLQSAEVEEIIEISLQGLNKVVIGKILDIQPHPDSSITKVRVTKTTIGNKELTIFCGAENIEIGMYVPVAIEGADLPCGIQIAKRDLKGVVSEGMICAKEELGLENSSQGIWNMNDMISDDNLLGKPLVEVLEMEEDIVLDIDNKTLSNRPDLFCHYGIAREVAAIWDTELKQIDIKEINSLDTADLNISIESEQCYRYTSVKIEDIKVASSPKWLQNRLQAVGINSVNNIVDITNWVMLSLGQPMHAFDYEKIGGGIKVRQAKKGESLKLLNDKEYKFNDNNLLICDIKNNPIALAGVMGGLDSGVNSDTTSILLESACFSPYDIRKTTTSLGVRSDSSTRYEKALDPELTIEGLRMATQMILDLCSEAKVTSLIKDIYQKKYDEVKLNFSLADLKRVIGIDFDTKFVEKTLLQLGFNITVKGEGEWEVVVPSWRATRDISIVEDIAEEVARIYGFDNIPALEPVVSLTPARVNFEKELEDKIKDIMSVTFNETHLYSFTNAEELLYTKFDKDKCIEMKNSLTAEATHLIPSLLIPLIKSTAHNVKYGDRFKIYTIDHVWPEGAKVEGDEKVMIGGVVTGYGENNFYEAKSEIQRLLRELGFAKKFINSFETEIVKFTNFIEVNKIYHPKQFAVIKIGDEQIGKIGVIHPMIAKNFDISQEVCYFEIDFERLFNLVQKINIKIEELSQYPSVIEDFSFIFDENIHINDIGRKVCDQPCPYPEKYTLTEYVSDVYKGKSVEAGKKSITFKYRLIPKNNTLTSEDINEFRDIIITTIEKQGGELRK